MKKLLYFLVSVLSLAVIFGAGWAAGTGSNVPQPANAELTDQDVPKDDCPEEPSGEDLHDCDRYRYGFRFRIPIPPVLGNRPQD